jgi:multiple sugar transport system substrate-binding protein
MNRTTAKWAAASSALLLTTVLAACQSGGNGGNAPSDASSGAPSSAAASPTGQASADSGDKTTVTVSVFTEDRFLKSAVEQFEQSHPNIDVQIQETVPTDMSEGKQLSVKNGPDGEDGPSQTDKDKYINAVGTALMSGNAADLISVSYLPIERYLDKGMFADWSQLAGQDADFHTSDYYERVLKGMSSDQLWYAIPIRYNVNAVLGNKAIIDQAGGVDDQTWDWQQFVDICRKIAQTKGADGNALMALAGMKPEDLLGYWVETSYDKLVSKQGKTSKFDEEAFRQYLEQVKQLFDSGAASVEAIGRVNTAFSSLNLMMPMELATLPSTLEDGEGEVLAPPGSGQDGYLYTSDLAFALNDRSKVKPAAWEFVKFLLSEQIQATPQLMGFPVQQAAARQSLEDFAKNLQSGGAKMMIKSKDGPAKSISVTDEQVEAALALLPKVGKYKNTDDKVVDMIKEEAASFFSGGKSADAVAKAVASRVGTYLNE